MPQRAPDSWWYGRVAGRPKSGRELESSWRVGADASFRALLIWLPRIGLLKRVAPSRPLAVCGWSSVLRCARSRGSQSSELQAALTAHGEAASRASRVPPSVSHFAPPSLLASADYRRRVRCTARCLGATTRRLGVRIWPLPGRTCGESRSSVRRSRACKPRVFDHHCHWGAAR